jgi:hypothetical protein
MSRTKSGPTIKLLVAFVAMTVTPSSSEAQSDMSPSLRLYEKQGGDTSKQFQQQSNEGQRLLQQKKAARQTTKRANSPKGDGSTRSTR